MKLYNYTSNLKFKDLPNVVVIAANKKDFEKWKRENGFDEVRLLGTKTVYKEVDADEYAELMQKQADLLKRYIERGLITYIEEDEEQ